MSKSKACWLKVPPECPVRVPVKLVAEAPSGAVAVVVGMFEGGDGCARVRIDGLEFSSEADTFDVAAADAMLQLSERMRTDLAVGRMVRTVIARRPGLRGVVRSLLLLLEENVTEVDREVLRKAKRQEVEN